MMAAGMRSGRNLLFTIFDRSLSSRFIPLLSLLPFMTRFMLQKNLAKAVSKVMLATNEIEL
jgi:hypothetical protein